MNWLRLCRQISKQRPEQDISSYMEFSMLIQYGSGAVPASLHVPLYLRPSPNPISPSRQAAYVTSKPAHVSVPLHSSSVSSSNMSALYARARTGIQLMESQKTVRGKIRSSLQALVSAFGCRARGSVSTTPHEETSSTSVPTALVEDLLCRIARNNHEHVNLDLLCCDAGWLATCLTAA